MTCHSSDSIRRIPFSIVKDGCCLSRRLSEPEIVRERTGLHNPEPIGDPHEQTHCEGARQSRASQPQPSSIESRGRRPRPHPTRGCKPRPVLRACFRSAHFLRGRSTWRPTVNAFAACCSRTPRGLAVADVVVGLSRRQVVRRRRGGSYPYVDLPVFCLGLRRREPAPRWN